jgi:hypothetical protein
MLFTAVGISLSLSSCISRLSRPKITGIIVDYDRRPIADCQVGESKTAADGSFTLKELRYQKFLISEMMIMEAPPYWVNAPIQKAGYEPDEIVISSKFGGGQKKGATYPMDTIYLKKQGQTFDVPALLKGNQWSLSFTKSADTVYMMRKGFNTWCKTSRCASFYSAYDALRDNYYSNKRNLPEGMARREITLKFGQADLAELQQIQAYRHRSEGPDKATDTLNTTLHWRITADRNLVFKVEKIAVLSKSYHLAMVDLYSLMLIKQE